MWKMFYSCTPDSLQESVCVCVCVCVCAAYPQLPSLSSETTIMNRALNRQLPFHCPSHQRHIIISFFFFNQSSLYIVNQSSILSFIVFGIHSLSYHMLRIDWNWFHATGLQSFTRADPKISMQASEAAVLKKKKKNTFIFLNNSVSDL